MQSRLLPVLRMAESSLSSTEFSTLAQETISILEERTSQVFAEVRTLDAWALVTDPTTPDDAVLAVVREIMLAVHQYQRHTTEAGFLMIGRIPKAEHRLIGALCHHKAEEAEHGLWARRDFLRLGGDARRLDDDATPACFTMASVWWRMANVEDPLGYLGAEYLFEYLTALVGAEFLEVLGRRGLRHDGLDFIVEHATEDVKHTNLLRHLVGHTVTRFPESASSMIRCFDYFRHCYPIPVWREAYERVVSSPDCGCGARRGSEAAMA